jgi:hypothetical protein
MRGSSGYFLIFETHPETPQTPHLMKPDFFSKYEWRYHLVMMPVLSLAGNYYFIGTGYFTNAVRFLSGTGCIFLLYGASAVGLTIVIRRIISAYPGADQSPQRVKVMFWIIGLLTILLSVFYLFIYTILPGSQAAFTLLWLWPIVLFSEFCNFLLCALLGLLYTLDQWKANQAESERLERVASEHRFNALKGQVNPHFLFNSLNTLSSLIGEDAERAENFVEDLAKIYRYMLQAAKTDLVPLSAELNFLETYIRLLQVRHGENLNVTQPAHYPTDVYVPPLVLQILVDHAVKYNVMSVQKPLHIIVTLPDNHNMLVQNNIQSKIRTMNAETGGLAELSSKYRALGKRLVAMQETDTEFIVTLPLLNEKVSLPHTAK